MQAFHGAAREEVDIQDKCLSKPFSCSVEMWKYVYIYTIMLNLSSDGKLGLLHIIYGIITSVLDCCHAWNAFLSPLTPGSRPRPATLRTPLGNGIPLQSLTIYPLLFLRPKTSSLLWSISYAWGTLVASFSQAIFIRSRKSVAEVLAGPRELLWRKNVTRADATAAAAARFCF